MLRKSKLLFFSLSLSPFVPLFIATFFVFLLQKLCKRERVKKLIRENVREWQRVVRKCLKGGLQIARANI